MNEDSIDAQFASLENCAPYRGADDPYHQIRPHFLDLLSAKKQKLRLLEIGSRNVTGQVRKELFPNTDYVGFDIHAGDNVDVVGDAHQLSSYFEPESFDAVFTMSVFEHLLMPWKVVLEMNKVLKPSGLVYLTTHPTWPAHELPWDFWRFQKNSFYGLFNRYTGFSIEKLEEGLPCRIVSLVDDEATRPLLYEKANLGVALIARKTGESDPELKWDVNLDDVADSSYPT